MSWVETSNEDWIKAVNKEGQVIFAHPYRNKKGIWPEGQTWYYFNLRKDGVLSNVGRTPPPTDELWTLAAEHFSVRLEEKIEVVCPLPAERTEPYVPPNVYRRHVLLAGMEYEEGSQ